MWGSNHGISPTFLNQQNSNSFPDNWKQLEMPVPDLYNGAV